MEPNRPQTEPITLAYATKAELDTLIKSKEHFIQLFSIQGRYYLPPPQFITWRFIRQVLDGSKELLPMSKVPCLYLPPKVSELTVKKLHEQVQTDTRITKFFPETTRPLDKKYFFTVLASILPDFYERVMTDIKESRKQQEPEDQKIQVTEQMQQLIARNTAYFGPEQKVGHFVTLGRKWTAPVHQQKQAVNLRSLF